MSENPVLRDTKNLVDKFSGWTVDLVRKELKDKAFPTASLMMQINQDFNFGSVVRSANSFGIGTIYYYGKRKHYDRRGCVGAHIYSEVIHLKEIEDVIALKSKFSFVALENNIDRETTDLNKFVFPKNTMFILGEECGGITEEVLNLADFFVKIPSFGSVRSINAACAASVAFYQYVSQFS